MALAPAFMGYFVYSYFMNTLNNATPKIAAGLNGMALYSWSVSIPSLGLAVGTILAGKLSDIYGRRAIMLGSVIILILGTILSSLSPTFVTFIAARTLHCLGMGAIAPLCYAVIGDVFTGGARSKWIGLLNIPVGICSLIGPPLGGWFVDNMSWRYLYWIALPLLIVCLVTVPIGVPSIVNRDVKRKIDVLGIIIVAIASSTAIVGLSLAGTYGWGSNRVLALLGVSLISWIVFIQNESRVQEPVGYQLLQKQCRNVD